MVGVKGENRYGSGGSMAGSRYGGHRSSLWWVLKFGRCHGGYGDGGGDAVGCSSGCHAVLRLGVGYCGSWHGSHAEVAPAIESNSARWPDRRIWME